MREANDYLCEEKEALEQKNKSLESLIQDFNANDIKLQAAIQSKLMFETRSKHLESEVVKLNKEKEQALTKLEECKKSSDIVISECNNTKDMLLRENKVLSIENKTYERQLT